MVYLLFLPVMPWSIVILDRGCTWHFQSLTLSDFPSYLTVISHKNIQKLEGFMTVKLDASIIWNDSYKEAFSADKDWNQPIH